MSTVKNLTGQRFGQLTVIRPADERRNGYVVWECRCDCGNTTFVRGDKLGSGHTKSCGCAKTLNLTGQRFGQLTVICPTEKRYHGRVVWECKCDCGGTAFVDATNLQTGAIESCGCASSGRGKKPVDISGRHFGRLTAVRATDERRNGSVVWECRCDCGNTAFVSVIVLCSGHTQSCGCMKPGKEATDLTGKRFGQLTVERKTDERYKGSIVWECKCDCGNIAYVPARYLRSNTTSCGCAKTGKKALDLTGQRFGWLTAVEPTEKRMFSNVIWKCKCDCGNISYVAAHNLRSGGTQSCGCSKSTKAQVPGEEL